MNNQSIEARARRAGFARGGHINTPNKYNTPSPKPRREYPANAVELIHQEVDTLVAEMPVIIEKRMLQFEGPDFAYARRLKAVGLTGTKQYIHQKAKIDEYETIERELLALRELQQTYPLRKFVLEKDLEKLMVKWEMVMAPLDRYTGEIPEKNLADIEAYKLVDEKFQAVDWASTFHAARRGYIQMFYSMDDTRVKGVDFRIIAFPTDLNLDGLTKNKKGLMYDYPKDPIVVNKLQYTICEVVTKWGPEASDPLLVNPNMN
jgi:hypothetical protein